jgi:hypothetical protein
MLCVRSINRGRTNKVWERERRENDRICCGVCKVEGEVDAIWSVFVWFWGYKMVFICFWRSDTDGNNTKHKWKGVGRPNLIVGFAWDSTGVFG